MNAEDYIQHKEPRLLRCNGYRCLGKVTHCTSDGYFFCDRCYADLLAEAEAQTEGSE